MKFSKSVYVLLNNAVSVGPVDLDCPEIRSTPEEYLETFLIVVSEMSEGQRLVVRTYAEPLINFIGSIIYKGMFKDTDFILVTDGSTYRYVREDDDPENVGTLKSGWPYGYMSDWGKMHDL